MGGREEVVHDRKADRVAARVLELTVLHCSGTVDSHAVLGVEVASLPCKKYVLHNESCGQGTSFLLFTPLHELRA